MMCVTPARSSHRICMAIVSGKAEAMRLSSGYLSTAENCAFARRQVPTCDCSGSAADAVRNRSIQPRSGREGAPGEEAARAPLALTLTPARWGAMRLACRLSGPIGSGGAVLVRTTLEPLQNHQIIDVARFSVRFSQFSGGASRDAHAGERAPARACEGGDFTRTLEPLNFLYTGQRVSGSRAVLQRFYLEPVSLPAAKNGGIARFSNKVGVRYCRGATDRLAKPVARGRGGETFAPGARRGARGSVQAAGAQLVDLELDLVGGNGGKLRIAVRGSGCVGRVMLEGMAERRGNACFPARCRQPVRLMRSAPWADPRGPIGPGHPPVPPAPAALSPSRVTRQSGENSNGSAPARLRRGCAAGARGRQTSNLLIGSGSGVIRPTGAGQPGRGKGEAWEMLARAMPRRSGDDSRGVAGVN